METTEEMSFDDPGPWPGPGQRNTQYSPPSSDDDDANWPRLPKGQGRPMSWFSVDTKPSDIRPSSELTKDCSESTEGEGKQDQLVAETKPGIDVVDCAIQFANANDSKHSKRTKVAARFVSNKTCPTSRESGTRDRSESKDTRGGLNNYPSEVTKGHSASGEVRVESEMRAYDLGKKRRRKWKRADELVFVTSCELSLCPEATFSEIWDEFDNFEDTCFEECDLEYLKFEEMCASFKVIVDLDVCGKNSMTSHRLRMTRKHKTRKAAKQVKDKYCRSVKNNNRKKLFMKHIVYKKMNIEQRGFNFLPATRNGSAFVNGKKQVAPSPVKKPIKKPKFEVDDKNISSELKRNLNKQTLNCLVDLQHRDLTDEDLVLLLSLEGGFMQDTFVETMSPEKVEELQQLEKALLAPPSQPISTFTQNTADQSILELMTRDLTPEDYELLIRLDDSVVPKTLETDLVKSLRTVIVMSDSVDSCPICMDRFEVGTTMKYLPCDHVFHERCVDAWLTERSMNCPLDGLPVVCVS